MVRSVQAVGRGMGGIGGGRSKAVLSYHVGVEKGVGIEQVRLGGKEEGRDRGAPGKPGFGLEGGARQVRVGGNEGAG